jgi:uncharacterized SAM-binding protein YcdF (DUF218 family)
MWIHHIGEIAIGFFILLIVLHFSVHFIFKALRMKKRRNALKQQQEE